MQEKMSYSGAAVTYYKGEFTFIYNKLFLALYNYKGFQLIIQMYVTNKGTCLDPLFALANISTQSAGQAPTITFGHSNNYKSM